MLRQGTRSRESSFLREIWKKRGKGKRDKERGYEFGISSLYQLYFRKMYRKSRFIINIILLKKGIRILICNFIMKMIYRRKSN